MNPHFILLGFSFEEEPLQKPSFEELGIFFMPQQGSSAGGRGSGGFYMTRG